MGGATSPNKDIAKKHGDEGKSDGGVSVIQQQQKRQQQVTEQRSQQSVSHSVSSSPTVSPSYFWEVRRRLGGERAAPAAGGTTEGPQNPSQRHRPIEQQQRGRELFSHTHSLVAVVGSAAELVG
ncbi:hypothetical protein niasHT_004216 [Heterodera trifolii]|uniref:Uncharacterized protein n=1 Tax=Heterodera trifolii TaxID=157864 RepID=A0ABD2ME07_9BILA